MCKEKSQVSHVTTMNSMIEGLKAELFTTDRENELQEIVETIFNEHLSNIRERIKTALSVSMDGNAPVVYSLKFRPSYDYHSMLCEMTDSKSSSSTSESIALSATTMAYFSNELNDLLCYRRFCSLLIQKFVAAGFDENQTFTVDISSMMQEYING